MAAPGNQELDRIVFGTRPANDPANLDILFEQYKLFVETSERLVARRQVVNTFFLSANALALSALGLIAKEASGGPFTAVAMNCHCRCISRALRSLEDALAFLPLAQLWQVRRDRPP